MKAFVRTEKYEHNPGFKELGFKEFKPSGRWCIKSHAITDKPVLWVEHKNFLFREWYREDDIVFFENVLSTNKINICSGKKIK